MFAQNMAAQDASTQNVPPIGELFASDSNSSSAMQLAGSGMAVYSGSELSAGIAPATLKLARGGQVRICPNSGLNVTASGQGLMLAMGTGALEIEYELQQQTADVVITPDFNVALVGPGIFHFALGINKRGDTCMKPLSGNTGEISRFQSCWDREFTNPDLIRKWFFRGGKLDGKTELTADCGCPAAAPVMRAEAQPNMRPPDDTPNPAEHVAVISDEPLHRCHPINQGKSTCRLIRLLCSAPGQLRGVICSGKGAIFRAAERLFRARKGRSGRSGRKAARGVFKANGRASKPEEKPRKKRRALWGG